LHSTYISGSGAYIGREAPRAAGSPEGVTDLFEGHGLMSIDTVALLMVFYRQVHPIYISGNILNKLLHLAHTFISRRPELLDLLKVLPTR
jgi:hypothetical protein